MSAENNKKSWAEQKLEELEKKGKQNWDEADWEAYNYVMNVNAEQEYFNRME